MRSMFSSPPANEPAVPQNETGESPRYAETARPPSDQIQSMWTESMWSKWNPNWSLYVSKPLFSG